MGGGVYHNGGHLDVAAFLLIKGKAQAHSVARILLSYLCVLLGGVIFCVIILQSENIALCDTFHKIVLVDLLIEFCPRKAVQLTELGINFLSLGNALHL